MAFSSRELRLIVTAQNQASFVLRRVGRDVAALGSRRDIQLAQRNVAAQMENVKAANLQTKAQLESLEVGSKRVAQNEKLAAQQKALSDLATRRLAIERQQTMLLAAEGREFANITRQQNILNNPRITRLQRSAAVQSIGVSSTNLKAAAEQTVILRRNMEGLEDTEATLALRGQRLAAVDTEMAVRSEALTAQLARQGESMAMLAVRQQDLAHAESQLKWTHLQTLGRVISQVSRVAATAGLITVAVFGAMAHSAAGFSSQVTLAATQSGMTFSQIQKNSSAIQNDILKQMQKFPATSEEVAKGFYDILSSMDVNTAGADKMMTAFQRTAVAGMAPLNDVVNAGITILNDFGKAAGTPEQAMNQLLATVRFGRLNVQQYTASLNQLVPAFSAAGQSSLQMNAAFAELTRLMPSQRMAATGLARLMELFGRSRVSEGLKQFGITIRDASGQMLPFNKIIEQFAKSSNPMIVKLREGRVSAQSFFKAISGTQGTIQAQRAFTNLILHADGLDKRLKQISGDSNELNRSFNSLRRTPGVEWQVFLNTMKAVAIEIGFSVIPAFQKMGHFISPVIGFLRDMNPHTRTLLATMILLSGTVLLVGGTIGILVGGLVSLSGTIGLMIGSRGLGGLIARLTAGRAGATALAGETGLVSVSMLRFLGIIGLIVVALPLLSKATGGTIQALKDLAIAFTVFKVATLVGLSGPIGILLAGVTLVAKVTADNITNIQKRTIAAQSYVAAGNSRLMTHGTTMFAKEIANMEATGMSAAEVFKVMKTRLGDSDNAAAVLAESFRKSNKELREMQRNEFLADRMLPKMGLTPRAIPIVQRIPTTGPLTDAQYQTRMRQIQRLRAAAERAPSLAHWRAYYAALDAVNKQATQAQQSAFAQIGTMTDRQVLALVGKIRILRAAYEKAPNIANWRKWWNAQQKLANQATDAQQQMAQDIGGRTATISDAAVMGQVKNINKLFAIASKHPSVAGWKSYYQSLNALQASASDVQMQVANQFLKTSVETTKKAASAAKTAAKQAVTDARQTLQQISGSLTATFTNLQQQNAGAFGQIFGGPFVNSARTQNRLQFGGKLTGRDLLTDLKAQVSQFKQWRNALNQLQKRGVPFELLQQIQQLGPAALPEIHALLSLPRQEFKQYERAFAQGQRVVAVASRRDMSSELKHWHSYGKNIMKAIMQGMDENSARFANYFRNLAISLFPQLAHAAKAKPRKATDPIVVAGQGRNTAHTVHHHTHNTKVTYQIPGTKDTDVKTALRKTKQFHKATYGGAH